MFNQLLSVNTVRHLRKQTSMLRKVVSKHKYDESGLRAMR